jgi:DNA processing protein
MSTINAKHWHALNLLIPGNLWKLGIFLEKLGNARAIYEANSNILKEGGLSPSLIGRIIEGRIRLDVEAEYSKLTLKGIGTVALGDPGYPESLAQVHSAPPLIYVRGSGEILNKDGLAVVGSRKLSTYGRNAIRELVPPLAGIGVNVISGMAYGADSAALESCLENGGVPVAVLASSLDWEEISPREHFSLAERIAQAGCLVSENPPGIAVHKSLFPLRNRIVSGLSLGVLVIEAARRSGTSITARLALEQGREVFAVPGSIFASNSQGTLDLIKRGAKCVTCAPDIAQELGWDLAAARESKIRATSPLAQKVIDLLNQEPQSADSMLQQLGCLPHELTADLTQLEMAGALRLSNDGVYHKVK